MVMPLNQILTHQQTLFALFIYCISIVVAIPVFELIHTRLDNYFLQMMWDKIGAPLLRTFLIIGFIILVYPLNYGIDNAPGIQHLLNIEQLRINFLINIIFLLTFFFPIIPIIGKWDELIIPLQGIICTMIIFGWLCQSLQINDYYLLPGISVFVSILLISLITHWIAEFLSHFIGGYLDILFDREGFKIVVFRCVLLLMQSPVIFIFGIALGKQLG